MLNLDSQERKDLMKAFQEASEYLYTSMLKAFIHGFVGWRVSSLT